MKPRIVSRDLRRVSVPQAKEADPFYVSVEWRAFCRELKQERWPLLILTKGHCCEDPDCTADHRPGQRIFFDHIVELKDGGEPFDPVNVMGRCGSSHTRKTLRQRGLRLARL